MYIIFTIGRTGSSLLVHILNKFQGVTFSGEIYTLDLLARINREDKRIPIEAFKVFGNKNILLNGRYSNSSVYFPNRTNYAIHLKRKELFIKKFHKIENVNKRLKFIMPIDKISGCKILTKSEGIKNFLNMEKLKDIKIILLVRDDIKAQLKSMKRAGFIKANGKEPDINYENKEYRKIYKENKGRVYYLSYEDMVNRTDRFKRLFKFMNIDYDEKKVISGSSIVCSYASSLIN